jgi:integrase
MVWSLVENQISGGKTMAKRTRGTYRRGNIWWLMYSGLDGQMHYESSKSTKFRDAEVLLHKRKADIQSGKQVEVKKIRSHSFNELVEEYKKWAERQRCFSSKIFLIRQLADKFGKQPLRRFTTMQIEQYQTERLQRNKPATVNRVLATLSHMFTKAVDWNMVEEEVQKQIRKVKMLQENNRRLRFLSKEECQTLINYCDPHLKPIVITALNTGMRKGNILNLRWEQVDLKHGFILLDITKNGERHEIPINNTLRATLLSQQRRLDIPYCFHDKATGKPYKEVKKSFATACRKAGIKDFRFHDLRHCFASSLVMAGVDLTTIKELLNHKSLTMTLRYAHLAPSHKVKAVEVLDEVEKSAMVAGF